MGTYSFLDVLATITGPGGNIDLSSGAGVAEEGITVAFAGDKSSMQVGADGEGQHSLHADRSGTVTVRLLKTSPTNALLNSMFRFQSLSAANAGQNMITVSNVIRGDKTVCSECAFRKHPDLVYSKDGPMMEWTFNAIKIAPIVGDGSPISEINKGSRGP